MLLSSVFDSPARCLFQNFIQFNGYYGCPFCLAKGQSVKTSVTGSTQTYPFMVDSDTGHGEPRTHQSTMQFAKEAHDIMVKTGGKKVVYGVKGYSCFCFVQKFDIIRSVAIDYMHGVMLGVVKMCTKLWFDSKFRTKPFSIFKKVKDVDRRLVNITPPNSISRPPRPISTHIKFWKASEYRSFLLFYAVPCLWGILPDEYFKHLLLLVRAVFLLLSESISVVDLKTANSLLKLYCLNIGKLYGERYYTSNMHSLLHYTDKVADLGPLWANSCFPFEDFNGDISKLFHGTRGVEMQVLAAVAINQKIPLLAQRLFPGSQEHAFYQKMTSRGRKIKLGTEIQEGIYIVGSFTDPNTCNYEEYFPVLFKQFGNIRHVKYFKRVSIRGNVFHSKSYMAVKKRNSYTVLYRNNESNECGLICTYVTFIQQCQKPSYCSAKCFCKVPLYFAIVEQLKKNFAFQFIDKANDESTSNIHVTPFLKDYRKLVVVPLTDVIQKCVWLDVGLEEANFLSVFPNNYEKD
ncbi:uncharacterized protein [Asterias amurensis]|uniref:uncharacterized protein n=1 Tax=Asterias amurensis TaxID=7602 RepID=UPI003AB86A43